MTYYNLDVCEDIIRKYANGDGIVITLEEGCLGLGTVICYGSGFKTTIIRERYLNEWSSTHTIRMYKKMPKKYEKWIEKVELEDIKREREEMEMNLINDLHEFTKDVDYYEFLDNETDYDEYVKDTMSTLHNNPADITEYINSFDDLNEETETLRARIVKLIEEEYINLPFC